ncbi:Heat shock 70 kDa protein 6 [Abeliophyllum distichum]|uniref:Heat shock 70 kDa protein 6 n=1 Tax=Abeliophyllum distichum TaxID=126358 RepID=A0ABD1P9N8_9LAMI
MLTAKGMAAEGCKFIGVLDAGLMIEKSGFPKLIEFNVDPECQAEMAASTAQIHALGATTHFASASATSRNPTKTVFLGSRLNNTVSFGLKMKNRVRSSSRRNPGAMEGGKPTIVTNAEGQRTTPSVVAYTKSGDRLVGQIAKRQAVVNPENTFFSVKRFIGRKMSEVDEESKQVSYTVVRDENGNVKLECPAIGKQFAAEEISAQVLRKLVDDASKFLNDKVTKAVVTGSCLL